MNIKHLLCWKFKNRKHHLNTMLYSHTSCISQACKFNENQRIDSRYDSCNIQFWESISSIELYTNWLSFNWNWFSQTETNLQPYTWSNITDQPCCCCCIPLTGSNSRSHGVYVCSLSHVKGSHITLLDTNKIAVALSFFCFCFTSEVFKN